VLSATVAVVTLDRAFELGALGDRLRDCEFMLDDMVSFVILWGGINLWYGNLLPAAVAVRRRARPPPTDSMRPCSRSGGEVDRRLATPYIRPTIPVRMSVCVTDHRAEETE